MTRLVSWTLAGPGTAPVIGDALRSVAPLISRAEIVWTGPESERIAFCEAVAPWAYCVTTWPWRDDFAAARNEGLGVAAGAGAEIGAEWGIMLDTDERVICPDPAAVRAYLAALPPEVCVVSAYASDLATVRERLFRLPARHRWTGRTHEAYPCDPGEQALVPPALIVWDFLPKTAEQLRAKNERDVRLLEAEVEDHPDEARWRFYLGAALVGLDRVDDAIESYRAAAERDHAEIGALSCVRAAELLISQGKHVEAVAACARGMTMRADLAELSWLAAGASWNAGQPAQAEAWAHIAKVHGERGASPPSAARWAGFRIPRALREGPDEILALVRGKRAPLTPDPNPIRIIVTSSAIRAEASAGRCATSVRSQTTPARVHYYAAADVETFCVAGQAGAAVVDGRGRGLLENLLPIWRILPDDEVIVWLDGDDWLATDHALATVAEMHAAGAWATYGQFITTDGTIGFCAPVGNEPRTAPWRSSHLKTFRAGLVKRIRDEDLRGPDGAYLTLAIDQAIMLPILEMADERAVFCPKVLAVYNVEHSFSAGAGANGRAKEEAAVALVRGRARYTRLDALDFPASRVTP